MTHARAAVLVLMVAVGSACSGEPQAVDGMRADSLVYVVHNEVFRITLDGNQRSSLGFAGFNRYRTGWPRVLPDGNVAVLGDEWGIIYPYVARPGGQFEKVGPTNVMVHDSLTGATIEGKSHLIMTVTPWSATRGSIQALDLDDNSSDQVASQRAGQLLHPSPYDDGRVLAVRTHSIGSNVEVIDVSSRTGTNQPPVVLAQVKWPWLATQPVRLPDGRVAFLRIAADDEDPLPAGDIYIIEPDGKVVESEFMSIIALTVVGDYLVMEAAGMDGVSDLVATDFKNKTFNITRTPYISEHLTWSD